MTTNVGTLGDLIALLERTDPDLPVALDGVSGLGLSSWRGYYAELSLSVGATTLVTGSYPDQVAGYAFEVADRWARFDPAETVGELLTVARAAAAGGEFSGYKGGVYTMTADTSLWADEWGTCPGRMIVDSHVHDGVLYLSRSLVDGES